MRGRFRPPMAVIAAALLGLIAILATLQYRWLGQISDAERERMTATLNASAAAFARDFDRELTLAYTVFQIDPVLRPETDGDMTPRFVSRYERWLQSARHPKLIKEVYLASRRDDGSPGLERFDLATRTLSPLQAWPASLQFLRSHFSDAFKQQPRGDGIVVRTMPGIVWEEGPALVVPIASPMLIGSLSESHPSPRLDAFLSFSVLVLDRDFMTKELLPDLAQQHFRDDESAYQLAVVSAGGHGRVYQSTAQFTPTAETKADARAELFQVRPQDFAQMIADVRRFIAAASPAGAADARTVATFAVPMPDTTDEERVAGDRGAGSASPRVVIREPLASSVVVDQTTKVKGRAVFTSVSGAINRGGPGKWQLLVKHPAGSLEAAVNSVRRRNMLVSSSILAVLAASLVLVVVSARQSQRLARQQMEFVAAVSHELRTPLAVIRSAGDNLADGVVKEDAQIRRYGALVKNEGRRLTEMVEQILELAGLQSGQRALQASPVNLDALIDQVLGTFDTLIDEARLRVERSIPLDLPAIAGDEAALRRVFQNLIGNAIKYGAEGGWIGVSASRAGSEVRVVIADRGIGIAPADQARIFEPFYRAADVVSAQVQGAGLGLSLVHRIVSAHGGTITVQSSKGSGSQFIVQLPVADGQPGASPAAGDLRPDAAPRPS